jgi:MFS superfamily sulfate permease-like transporter
MFVTLEDQEKTSDPHVHYYSEERLGTAIKVIIAVFSTALLLIPIYLFLSCSLSLKLEALITLLFALLFATAISVFTSARRQDVFAATAAYCAVLVVFIGNLQQRQMSA